jgi:hypothetical protein
MAVSMRERPIVTGRDAEKFMENVRKNNEFMRQRRQNRKIAPIKNESNYSLRTN